MTDAPLSGIELRIWRLSHGLSQIELSKRWDCSVRSISRWEAGVKHVRKWVRFAMRGYDAEHGGNN